MVTRLFELRKRHFQCGRAMVKPMPKLKRDERRAARHRLCRKPRPRLAAAAGFRRAACADDAERDRRRRRSAARHRAAHPVHAAARRLRLERRQAVRADAACADAGGRLSALEPSSRCCSRCWTGSRSRRRRSPRSRCSTATTSCSLRAAARRGFSPAASISAIACRRSARRSAARCSAGFGDAELKTRLAAMKREALTPQTVTDPKRLLRRHRRRPQRAAIRWSIARPSRISARSRCRCRRYDGAIVAAINIGAHVDRISTEEMVSASCRCCARARTDVKARLL